LSAMEKLDKISQVSGLAVIGPDHKAWLNVVYYWR